ncbi:zinc ribbon domain-containing protein [Vogesella sp. DC21W]|uniref:Zinc ribbon domain-containing protein n=1 Tax=Vogesella aquatica TaxID=2984206 RepID=A0ABT5J281_9NEIS|nr:zinc ribbon domain-containing protein [Vogesella aquatica]MDC7718962.1 zinc ribbon domain-containing protein [Vogesella aquatica]
MTEPELIIGAPLSTSEEEEVAQVYEQRADHLELNTFAQNTVLTNDTEEWIRALTGTGAKLLVGPRGCGKTHLMRFAFSECQDNVEHPLAIYTNLNRYYRLEPLLRKRPDAIPMFYTWVLSNIFVALHEALGAFATQQGVIIDRDSLLELNVGDVQDLIGTLEQSRRPLNNTEDELASRLTVDRIKAFFLRSADALSRRRVVLLLDDAALTLTPEYLSHFFDIFRALKAARIAPKASVYPGTTEYGPSFHAAHEADSIFVWKAVTDGNYLNFMADIGRKRCPDAADLPEETRTLLAYAAFGVPRSFMSLVQNYVKGRKSSSPATAQSLLNRVIEDFCSEKMREYLSLREKKPQLATIISVGAMCFNKIVSDLAEANQALADGTTRQIYVGIAAEGVDRKPYVERMLRLLEEVGMIYKFPSVSHGDREYVRYVPHLAALQNQRAFTRKGAFSPKLSVEILQRPDEKHAVRRSISTLLEAETIDGLGLDLPNCLNCHTKRVEGAKYCFQCGAKLTDESSYDRVMQSLLADVPGLTDWQREKLSQASSVPQTIGEFLALQDRGTTLRTIPRIGKIRAATVIGAVEAYLEEYLS